MRKLIFLSNVAWIPLLSSTVLRKEEGTISQFRSSHAATIQLTLAFEKLLPPSWEQKRRRKKRQGKERSSLEEELDNR